MKVIFAQGNPGRQYEKTRHNTGFRVLEAFGDAKAAAWKDVEKFMAHIAEVNVNGEKVLLVKPTSFYNETGRVARALIDFYKLDPATDLLVIHDDLALPLGTIRVRQKGSDAGNNGIRSLNTHLGDAFHRIRIGIWTEERNKMDDVHFVLGGFNREEAKVLEKDVIPKVIEQIDTFLAGNLQPTSL